MKIVKFLEESGLLVTGVTETIKNEPKEQRDGFLGMLSSTLAARLLGSVLAGKGVIWSCDGVTGSIDGNIRAGKGVIRAGQDF